MMACRYDKAAMKHRRAAIMLARCQYPNDSDGLHQNGGDEIAAGAVVNLFVLFRVLRGDGERVMHADGMGNASNLFFCKCCEVIAGADCVAEVRKCLAQWLSHVQRVE